MTFTAADVVAQVRALAQEQPHHLYVPPAGYSPDNGKGCSYVYGADGQGCVVGQALTRLGVPHRDLLAYEGRSAAEVVLRLAQPSTAPNRDLEWLNIAQEAQDAGQPWFVAVATADMRTQR